MCGDMRRPGILPAPSTRRREQPRGLPFPSRFALLAVLRAFLIAAILLCSALSPTASMQSLPEEWFLAVVPEVTDYGLEAVAHGGGKFAVVGRSGTILSSADGESWYRRESGTQNRLAAVGYGDGLFVAVGGAGELLTSADAENWVFGPELDCFLNGVAYGEGTWIAVGEDKVVISTDGWQSHQATSRPGGMSGFVTLYGATYGDGKFVVVGGSGTILSSADGGTSWIKRELGTREKLYAVTYGEAGFVVGGTNRLLLVSRDLVAWSEVTVDAPDIPGYADVKSVTYGDSGAGGIYVAVLGSGHILTSGDAVTWRACRPVQTVLTGATYGSNMFVAVGGSPSTGPVILRSEFLEEQPDPPVDPGPPDQPDPTDPPTQPDPPAEPEPPPQEPLPTLTPAAPTGLAVTPVSDTRLDLAWTDRSDNEAGFVVERSQDGGAGWVEVAWLGSGVTVFTDTALTPGMTYYYRVKAYNAVGDSPYTDVAGAATRGADLGPGEGSGSEGDDPGADEEDRDGGDQDEGNQDEGDFAQDPGPGSVGEGRAPCQGLSPDARPEKATGLKASDGRAAWEIILARRGRELEADSFVTRAEFATLIVNALGLLDLEVGHLRGRSLPGSGGTRMSELGRSITAEAVSRCGAPVIARRDGVSGYVCFDSASGWVRVDDAFTRARLDDLLGWVRFDDVPEEAWFAPFVYAAARAGVVRGYGDGSFRPEDLITRAESAAMTVRALKARDELGLREGRDGTLTRFTDGHDVPKWAEEEVAAAIEAGILVGFGDGSLRATHKTTRAQAEMMVARLVTTSPSNSSAGIPPGGGVTSPGGAELVISDEVDRNEGAAIPHR